VTRGATDGEGVVVGVGVADAGAGVERLPGFRSGGTGPLGTFVLMVGTGRGRSVSMVRELAADPDERTDRANR
jgi:hypothetical protein